MNMKRFFRHALLPGWMVRRLFSPAVMCRVEETVRTSERSHRGELRVAVEAHLELGSLWRGLSTRARAEQVFAQLRVWDTEENSGVLLYINCADRNIEIVADRGINRKVASQAWESICGEMQRCFAQRRFEEGAVAGLVAISDLLVTHYPAVSGGSNPDELPNDPHLL